MPPKISDLCDALEIIAFQARRVISVDDFEVELSIDDRTRAEEVFEYCTIRHSACNPLYPFDVSVNRIRYVANKHFQPYIFLLLGSNLFLTTDPVAERVKVRFRRYFEDFVCFAAGNYLGGAVVFSEPRSGRGLSVSIESALAEIATMCNEPGRLYPPAILQSRLSPHDNDLGADVIAWLPATDLRRTGRPLFFVQCATSRHDSELDRKLSEKRKLFCDMWEEGFFAESASCVLATPRDLIDVDPVMWRRLSKQGWVLDRIRIINLLKNARHQMPLSRSVPRLWSGLRKVSSLFDYRHGWAGD